MLVEEKASSLFRVKSWLINAAVWRYLMRFYGKDYKTGLVKIVAHLTNRSPSNKRFSNRPIRFPGSNHDSGEITGNVIGSARSKDLTALARGLSPISTTRSDAPRRWRARRPLASRVTFKKRFAKSEDLLKQDFIPLSKVKESKPIKAKV